MAIPGRAIAGAESVAVEQLELGVVAQTIPAAHAVDGKAEAVIPATGIAQAAVKGDAVAVLRRIGVGGEFDVETVGELLLPLDAAGQAVGTVAASEEVVAQTFLTEADFDGAVFDGREAEPALQAGDQPTGDAARIVP